MARYIIRTDLEIMNAGDFVKVGKRHYRHVSGIEITYDVNKTGYRISNQPGWVYPNLHSAVSQTRYTAGRAA